VVFTLPAAIADIAYQNNAAIYNTLGSSCDSGMPVDFKSKLSKPTAFV
jgi:hypothetical protein